MGWQQLLILFVAAMLGGAVNSVAGGGTLLTFPALLGCGEIATIANATSTVALWPGQLSSLFGYRKELGENRDAIVRLALPSFAGGAVGALLLTHTPPGVFARLVPYLILMATLLFMAQSPLSRWQKARAASSEESGGESLPEKNRDQLSTAAWTAVIGFQFLVAIYGGYFGAGIGILQLAYLGLMGFTNIHRMNGLKNINGLCINGIAVVIFIANGLVQWPIALWMASGAIFGGYAGAGVARRIGQTNVRRVVIFIGLALTLSLLVKQPRGGDTPGVRTPASRLAR